jgi:hypothetical protein
MFLVVNGMADMIQPSLFLAALPGGQFAMVVVTIASDLAMKARFAALKAGGLDRRQPAAGDTVRDPLLLPVQS